MVDVLDKLGTGARSPTSFQHVPKHLDHEARMAKARQEGLSHSPSGPSPFSF